MPTTAAKTATKRPTRRKVEVPAKDTRKLRSIQGEQQFSAADALSSYDEAHLECRDLRHPWRVVGYFREAGRIKRLLACSRCSTERIDVWRANGERVSNQYRYPEGYQIKGGHLSPHDVRREALSRTTVFESQDQMLQSLFARKTSSRKRQGA